jgi:hypothetical protein
MKRVNYLTVFICAIILTNISCTKGETNDARGAIQKDCCLTVVKTQSASDSLLYEDNQIYRYNTYDILGYTSIGYKTRFQYNKNEVRIYRTNPTRNDGIEELSHTLIFKDSKLYQIRRWDGTLAASYYYDGNKLRYFLYHGIIDDVSLVTDSLSVKYDIAGNNIVEVNYYNNNGTGSKILTLYHASSLLYDDKNNPFQCSVYFLSKYWEQFDLSVAYFNLNNILSLDSDNRFYSYNDKDYPASAGNGNEGQIYYEYLLK